MGLAEGAHWRCTAGLEETSKGEMYIGGRLINDVPPKDRDIAMVFQSYALYPPPDRLQEHRIRSGAAQDPERRDRQARA